MNLSISVFFMAHLVVCINKFVTECGLEDVHSEYGLEDTLVQLFAFA